MRFLDILGRVLDGYRFILLRVRTPCARPQFPIRCPPAQKAETGGSSEWKTHCARPCSWPAPPRHTRSPLFVAPRSAARRRLPARRHDIVRARHRRRRRILLRPAPRCQLVPASESTTPTWLPRRQRWRRRLRAATSGRRLPGADLPSATAAAFQGGFRQKWPRSRATARFVSSRTSMRTPRSAPTAAPMTA